MRCLKTSTAPGAALFALLLCSTLAVSVCCRAQGPPDDLPVEAGLYDRLDLFACPEVSYICYQLIPDFFYRSEADSLADLLFYWDDGCGPAEPIMRTTILGAIWDGAFDESLYNSEIIYNLIWRYDDVRMGERPDEVFADLAPGDLAREMDFLGNRDDYDAFTRNLSDQLLPHVSRGSLEEFFCLFYAGQVDSAYARLQGDSLVGTDLRWYYDNFVDDLKEDRWVPSVALTGGYWLSEGKLGLVGDHFAVGAMGAVRDRGWLMRLSLDVRLGRSDNPYYVNKGEIEGWSDRFNGVFATVDLGRTLVTVGSNKLDVYVGLGVLSLKPFSESELTINGLAYTVGAGYRHYLGQYRRWFFGADGQHEWIDELPTDGTELVGGGWTWRLAVGMSFNKERDRRLSGLGQ